MVRVHPYAIMHIRSEKSTLTVDPPCIAAWRGSSMIDYRLLESDLESLVFQLSLSKSKDHQRHPRVGLFVLIVDPNNPYIYI